MRQATPISLVVRDSRRLRRHCRGSAWERLGTIVHPPLFKEHRRAVLDCSHQYWLLLCSRDVHSQEKNLMLVPCVVSRLRHRWETQVYPRLSWEALPEELEGTGKLEEQQKIFKKATNHSVLRLTRRRTTIEVQAHAARSAFQRKPYPQGIPRRESARAFSATACDFHSSFFGTYCR